jgi:hypothetical protein
LQLGSSPPSNSLRNKPPVSPPRFSRRIAELLEHVTNGLPGAGHPPHQRAVPSPGIPVERGEIFHHPCPQWIQVEIPHEF